ncbi:hypothetical protein YPPY13_2265, partial [Yersinia pestis PY-13]|jgi:hypothetical protein
MPG